MSFHIGFTVHDDGAIELTSASPAVPPGNYVIAGHTHNPASGDWPYNTISISGPYASVSGGAQVHTKETAQ